GLMGATVHSGTRGRRLTTIPGSPPDLRLPIIGCAFAPRCPHADSSCRIDVPPLRGIEDGRAVRCVRFEAAAWGRTMLFYIFPRLTSLTPISRGVSPVCSLLAPPAPGAPVDALVPPDSPPAVFEQVRAQFGLDQPLPVQFGIWVAKVAQGD